MKIGSSGQLCVAKAHAQIVCQSHGENGWRSYRSSSALSSSWLTKRLFRHFGNGTIVVVADLKAIREIVIRAEGAS